MIKLFKPFHFISVCLLLLLGTSGCGYTTSSTLPARFKSIYVEPFENKTEHSRNTADNVYLPLLEVDVRNAVIDRYLFDGNLRIGKEEDASLILRGTLKGYERGTLRFTEGNDAQEYRVYIIVSLELWDVEKGEAVWRENGFVGEATFFVDGPQATSEESAVEEAITDLARRIVERTVENW